LQRALAARGLKLSSRRLAPDDGVRLAATMQVQPEFPAAMSSGAFEGWRSAG